MPGRCRADHAEAGRAGGDVEGHFFTIRTEIGRHAVRKIDERADEEARDALELLVLLADRGRLNLSDPLSRFLPEFPNAEAITVQQLLLHRSGLANPDYRDALVERTDLEGLIDRIAAQPPAFAPGTRRAGAWNAA